MHALGRCPRTPLRVAGAFAATRVCLMPSLPMADYSVLSLSSSTSSFSGSLTVSRQALDEANRNLRDRGRNRKVDFFDPVNHRCTLCDLHLECSFAAHTVFYEHVASLAILERAVGLVNSYLTQVFEPERLRRSPAAPIFRRHVPDPQTVRDNPAVLRKVDFVQAVVTKWWDALQGDAAAGTVAPFSFGRLRGLSSDDPVQRRWRLRYLLRFLKSHGVLTDSLGGILASSKDTFSRTNRFERFEMIGDSIVKNVVPDRLRVLFPLEEGGTTNELGNIQQLLDSNPGLLSIYDYIGLDDILGARLPNSKSKSDVVEALFGDLQSVLWAMESFTGSSRRVCALDAETLQLRAVVQHTLNELAHTVIMWRVEKVLRCASSNLDALTTETYLLRSQETGKRRQPKETEWDRAKYAPLPVITTAERQHPTFPIPGKEQWHHARSEARTQPGIEQLWNAKLTETPSPRPAALTQHYRGRFPVRVTKDRSADAVRSTRCDGDLSMNSPAGSSSSPLPAAAADAVSRYPAWDRSERAYLRYRDALQTLSPVLADERELNVMLEQKISELVASEESGEKDLDGSNASTRNSRVRPDNHQHPDFTLTPRPDTTRTLIGNEIQLDELLQRTAHIP